MEEFIRIGNYCFRTREISYVCKNGDGSLSVYRDGSNIVLVKTDQSIEEIHCLLQGFEYQSPQEQPLSE